MSGDEASRNHGGASVSKRSDSPNSFLDQETRRREEEEPVYCTTPTYGTHLRPVCVCVCVFIYNSEDQNASAHVRALGLVLTAL